MMEEQRKSAFLGLTQSSMVTILTGAIWIGIAWAKLSSVEATVKSLSDKVELANKSQIDFQLSVNKAQMELQLSEKLIEARVLSLEQQIPKHR